MEWLDAVQERIVAEIEGMTPEEECEYFRQAVENGPFADMFSEIRKHVPEPPAPAAVLG